MGGVLMLCLVGCAAVQSQVIDDRPVATAPNLILKPTPDGIVYYMPRRPFIVTVTTPAATAAVPNPPGTAGVSQGTAEADLSQRFILSQGTNLVAKTEMNITIGANGLLKTSNTTATSEVATALQNAASAAGTIAGFGAVPPVLGRLAPAPPPDGCPPPGTSYQYLIYPSPRDNDPKVSVFCNYTVTWHLAAGATNPGSNSNATPGEAVYSGVFYRHELPYVVMVTGPKDANGNAVIAVSVLTSPNDSEIDFFPVRESFFANNTANITLADGVVTGVDQTTDGELTAALSLPATVIGNYTSAIGNLLGNITTNSSDTQKLLAQQQSTASAVAQATVCRATIAANPLTGLTGADLTKALAAITAACP